MFSCMAFGDDVPRFMPYQEGFHRIFPAGPGVKVAVDSERDEKPLRMTEGPTWLGGHPLFLGPAERAALAETGRHVSQINFQGWTCGTAPLKTGNLAVCYVESTTVVEMNPDGKSSER